MLVSITTIPYQSNRTWPHKVYLAKKYKKKKIKKIIIIKNKNKKKTA